MRPCYFWISVTFGPCTAYVLITLVIIKHFANLRQIAPTELHHTALYFQCISQGGKKQKKEFIFYGGAVS